MSRYTHLDTDAERLPSGMQRVGYDADTQQYTYQDSDGSLWQGAENDEYGPLLPQNGNRANQVSASAPAGSIIASRYASTAMSDADTGNEDLLDGMQRLGYDASRKSYVYQGVDGSIWHRPEGAADSSLRPLTYTHPRDREQRILEHNEEIDDDTREAWRYLLPGILVIFVVLIMAWKLF